MLGCSNNYKYLIMLQKNTWYKIIFISYYWLQSFRLVDCAHLFFEYLFLYQMYLLNSPKGI